ncbi:hypothetical protein RE428_26750 [Marinobacter nanhaiticus D15-8W]|nr:hypothetical protein RE428_26750 [Marinobacter nanhaiticus D15-8W]
MIFAGASSAEEVPPLPPAKDVRIVVDISGSMRDSDPQNLRQPAVRLLARMLPEDARSGVWTFGQYVNMLVPSGEVSPDWRDRAVERSDEINSVALRTNIGEALEVASDDFYGDRQFDNTHFILLTDGVVDVSPQATVNARERNRILDDVVERIRSRGATIHTIALSDNADLALLERLAVETGGTFAVAPDAESLNRVFAETLNTAAPQPEVPIRDNGFTVSDDVKEFTALIFREVEETPLALISPDGQRIEVTRTPDNVRWYAEGEYDLITVTEPQAGDWQIDGQLGEQSRVTVVSDLRMAVSPIPNFFYTGQPVSIEAAFYEKDKPITNTDFLGVLDVSLTLKTEDGRSGTKSLSGETPPDDGVYTDTIEKLSEPGTYDLTLSADGKTFARQYASRVTLRPPVNVEVRAEGQGSDARYVVEVRPEHPELDIQQSEVEIQVGAPDQSGDPGFETLAFDQEAGLWRTTIAASKGDGEYPVRLRFRGQTNGGLAFNYAPSPFVAEFPRGDADGAAYTSLSAPTVTTAKVAEDVEAPSEPDGQAPLLGPETAEQPQAEEGTPVTEPEQPAVQSEPVEEQSSGPVEEPQAQPEEDIVSPIDVSQVETPAEEAPAEEEASFWEQIPLWVWGALGGVVILGGAAFGIMTARRKKKEAPDEASPASSDEGEVTEPEAVPPVVEPEEEDKPEAEAEEPLAEMDLPEADEQEPEPPVAVPATDLDEPSADFEAPSADIEKPSADDEEPSTESEQPPIASEEPGPKAADSADVPVLEETEVNVVDEASGTEEWPDEVEPPIASTEVPGEEDLTGADEKADEIERFLAEARRDQDDLDIENEDILEEPESPATENVEDDEHMLEDFDLSDIDDLPDLDEEPDEDASRGESERRRQK